VDAAIALMRASQVSHHARARAAWIVQTGVLGQCCVCVCLVVLVPPAAASTRANPAPTTLSPRPVPALLLCRAVSC
jgi:hypothetical protein